MKHVLPFLNRTAELKRLKNALRSDVPGLLVVYGRRRLGKSRLLQEVATGTLIYHLADERDAALQRRRLARDIAAVVPEFDRADYPDWESLFRALSPRLGGKGLGLILDEFPYLAAQSPELPSVLQGLIDKKSIRFHLVLCGSSQRLMHGIVLDKTAPLFGRADEILKIGPLPAGWLCDALKCTPRAGVEQFAVWGGVPRYWEVAAKYQTQTKAIRSLVLDRNGLLHTEPQRLLIDDMRSATQSASLLSTIANGAHRLSEIAGRLQKRAPSLSRPLDLLIDLGYIRRETPFGESSRSTKRTLYRLCDPFLLFWYRYVAPYQSLLERDLHEPVVQSIHGSFNSHVSDVWEQLTRDSVPYMKIGGRRWMPASRWWGTCTDGSKAEIDIVAESFDGARVLLGEAKWTKNPSHESMAHRMQQLGKVLPFVKGRPVTIAVWVPRKTTGLPRHVYQFDAADVMRALR